MSYGDALPAEARAAGDVPVMSSGGVTGEHDRANTTAPAIVVGRKGSHGSVHWSEQAAFVIDTAYWIDHRSTENDLRWIYYLLRSLDLAAVSQDVGVPGLAREAAYALRVPVPPQVEEQRRIADFLDDQVGLLNKAIGAQEAQRSLLLERFRSMLGHETLLGRESAGSERTRLRYLFEYERNGIWGSDPDGGPDDVPCVRVADFDREQFIAMNAPTIRSVPASQRLPRLLRRGDVLLEKSGGTLDKPVGCAVNYQGDEPAVCSNFVAALRPRDGVVPRFAGFVMAAMYQTRRNGPFVNQTTGIQNIDSSAYLAQEIWIPHERGQEAVVSTLETESERIQQLIQLADQRVRLLEERTQALITAAVTGQLDVTTAWAVA